MFKWNSVHITFVKAYCSSTQFQRVRCSKFCNNWPHIFRDNIKVFFNIVLCITDSFWLSMIGINCFFYIYKYLFHCLCFICWARQIENWGFFSSQIFIVPDSHMVMLRLGSLNSYVKMEISSINCSQCSIQLHNLTTLRHL